jgi:hypothetical protein
MMSRIKSFLSLAAVLVFLPAIFCGKGPEVVFPVIPGPLGKASGFISPAGVMGTAYLFEDVAFDSAVIQPSTGFFFFDSVPSGRYELRVVVPGFGIPRRVVYIGQYGNDLGMIYLSRLPSQVSQVYMKDSTRIGFSSCGAGPRLLNSTPSYTVQTGDTAVNFRIDFRQKMDSSSVVSALKIEPATQHRVTCSTDGSIGILVVSFPVMELFKDSVMTLTIGRPAKTIYGEGLDFDLTLSYFISTACYGQAVFSTFLQKTIPYNGQAGVATENDIYLFFRAMMNEMSVQKALSILPPEPMNFFWSTTSDSMQQLRIVLPSALKTNTKYTVTLDSTARRADSTRIPVPVALSFTTAHFMITRYSPLNGDLNVPVDSPFEYRTNVPVDSSSFLKAFSIRPAVDSIWISVADSAKKVIVHHTYLTQKQAYTVTIDTNLSSAKGMRITYGFMQSFTTGSFPALVRSVFPPDTLVPVSTNDSIVIAFSGSMVPASFDSRVAMLPTVPFLTKWEPSTVRQLVCAPMQVLRSNTLYTVTIDSGYRTVLGKTGDAFSFKFKTLPLTATSMMPFDGQIDVALDVKIQFSFNTPVDTAVLLSHISFKPKADSTALVSGSGLSGNTWTVAHAPLTAGTSYTVTLDSAVTDIYGVPMRRSVAFQFTTRK